MPAPSTPFLPNSGNMTPDQILNFFGPKNGFLISIFAFMSFIWALVVMPILASAFFLGKVCGTEEPYCIGTPGTVAFEFDLNGNRAYLADFTTTAFLVGNVIGASLMTRLSDSYGRRPTLAICMLMMGLSGSISAISPNVYFFAFCRFIQGYFFAGCIILNWVHSYECCPHLLRPYCPLVFGLMWVVGYCFLAPLDYWLQNWRPFMVALSLPSAIYAIGVQCWAPESFHFSVANARRDQAVEFIDRANQCTEVKLKLSELDHLFKDTSNEDESVDDHPLKGHHGVVDELKKQKVLIVYALVLAYLWTCDIFIYYGLSLFSTELAGNRYLNFILSGLIEVPSYLATPYCLRVLGRQWFVSLSHFITAIAFLGVVFINNTTVYLIVWLIGKFGISCALTALYVYASEVFPTTVRSSCIGFCSTLGRIGGTFAPSVRILGVIHPQIPNILFISMATVGGFLTFILPETAGRELPDEAGESIHSIDDLE